MQFCQFAALDKVKKVGLKARERRLDVEDAEADPALLTRRYLGTLMCASSL